jgi:tRNA uridine 5-carboxymethylaminomethyl modification enzyme
VDQVEAEAKYSVYLERQSREIAANRRAEGFLIPADFCYADVPGLSSEVRFRLSSLRPSSLGQAGRMEGVTPAAMTVLASYLRRRASEPVG